MPGQGGMSSNQSDGNVSDAIANGARWKCDVCQSKYFENYEEAVKHEALCLGAPLSLPSPSPRSGPSARCQESTPRVNNVNQEDGMQEAVEVSHGNTSTSTSGGAHHSNEMIEDHWRQMENVNKEGGIDIPETIAISQENTSEDITIANLASAQHSTVKSNELQKKAKMTDVKIQVQPPQSELESKDQQLIKEQNCLIAKLGRKLTRYKMDATAAKKTASQTQTILDKTKAQLKANKEKHEKYNAEKESKISKLWIQLEAREKECDKYRTAGNNESIMTDAKAKDALKTLLGEDVDIEALPLDILQQKITKIQELCGKLPVGEIQMQSKPKRRKMTGELGRLEDHLAPGLHDHAPNGVSIMAAPNKNNTFPTGVNGRSISPTRNRLTKQSSQSTGNDIVTRHWNDATNGGIVIDRPVHYCVLPPRATTTANKLKDDLLRRFSTEGKNDNGAKSNSGISMIYSAMEVEPGAGYFKAHVSDEVSVSLIESLDVLLPEHLQIKQKATQKSIMFYNSKKGQCDAHFDRDSSALLLVSGRKTVKIARPIREWERLEDGILHDVDPFSLYEVMHGGFHWETVHMVPGSVIFLPKYWLHCVESDPDTLALSFQVELKDDVRHTVWEQPREEPQYQPPPVVPLIDLVATNNTRKRKLETDCDIIRNVPAIGVIVSASAHDYTEYGKMGTNSSSQAKLKLEESAAWPLRRKSTRQKFKCGICSSNGFVGDGHVKEEMWVLRFQGGQLPANLPECPTNIPQHLMCFKCCPRNKTGLIGPDTIINYPGGKLRPILTRDEFFMKGNIKKSYFNNYEYVTGSDVDYTTKFFNQGQALLGQAGGEYDANMNEMIMIKSEIEK